MQGNGFNIYRVGRQEVDGKQEIGFVSSKTIQTANLRGTESSFINQFIEIRSSLDEIRGGCRAKNEFLLLDYELSTIYRWNINDA